MSQTLTSLQESRQTELLAALDAVSVELASLEAESATRRLPYADRQAVAKWRADGFVPVKRLITPTMDRGARFRITRLAIENGVLDGWVRNHRITHIRRTPEGIDHDN